LFFIFCWLIIIIDSKTSSNLRHCF
jgi:hypothetical protein